MLANAMATHMEYGKGNTFLKKQVQTNLINTINENMEQTPVNKLIMENSKRQMGLTTPIPDTDVAEEQNYILSPFIDRIVGGQLSQVWAVPMGHGNRFR
jgi:hypothetical protein